MINKVYKKVINKISRCINQLHAYDFHETGDGWEKYQGNPILKSSEGECFFDPFVKKIGDKFIMCVSKRSDHSLQVYESIDGIEWDNGRCILKGVENSKWETEVNRGCFLFHNNKWYLWYTGQHRKKSCIGLAISEDGYLYKRVQSTPVIGATTSIEGKSVMNPCVIYDNFNKVFRMWYAAGENYEPDVICYAESQDGIVWKKRNEPIIKADLRIKYMKYKVGACDVLQNAEGNFCMAFIAYQNINVARIAIAYSKNGIDNWKLNPNNPIISPGKKKWDGHATYKPALFIDKENGNAMLWYNGRLHHKEQIGLAVNRNFGTAN